MTLPEALPAPPRPPAFGAVVAADADRGIGRDGALPWHLPEDLRWFRRVTVGDGDQAVVMGRRTWESIPERYRPLPERRNLVLSRREGLELPHGVLRAGTLEEALERAADARAIYVIGGGEVYAAALRDPRCTRLYLTRVDAVHDCDTHLPELGPEWQQTADHGGGEHNGVHFRFLQFDR